MSITDKITLLNGTILESLDDIEDAGILQKFTDTAIHILDADFGFAWLKAEGARDFRLAYKSQGMPYEPATPRKHGTNQQVLKREQPLFVEDVLGKKTVRADARPHMRAFISIAIHYKNKAYGSIVICFRKKKSYSAEEKSLAAAIGNTAAQAITISRLYSNIRLTNKDLERLVDDRTKKLVENRDQIRLDKAKDEALLNSIGEGILAIDSEGIIILINPTAAAILGRKAGQLLGKSLFKVQPLYGEDGSELAPGERPAYKALVSGRTQRTGRAEGMYYKRKNGLMVPVSITATPVFFRNKIIGIVQVFRDITQEREIDRVKSELISLASHQLRTPLSAINWYTEALVKEEIGKLNPNQKRYLTEIVTANQKMVEMVYDFLNVSRIELGTFSIKLSALDISEVSQGIIKELQPLIGQKSLRVRQSYGKGLANIEADRKIIRLVIQNLMSNAIKYTPAKGKISIQVSLEPKNDPECLLHLTVSDTGYGIPKKQQGKIFTKLFRADNALKLDTQGSGLGLYLVKSFLDFCKGRISFTSQESRGTTFYVSIPVKKLPPGGMAA